MDMWFVDFIYFGSKKQKRKRFFKFISRRQTDYILTLVIEQQLASIRSFPLF